MHTYTISYPIPTSEYVGAGVDTTLPPYPPETYFFENSILIDTFTPDFTEDLFINRPAPGPLELAKIKKAERRMLRERRKSRYFYPPTPRRGVTVSGPPPLEHKSVKAKAAAARFGDVTREGLQELADMWTLKMAAATF
ncbi:hypothetical protein M378DRAFT_160584, partial [Amanita muscaria Koide BX008]